MTSTLSQHFHTLKMLKFFSKKSQFYTLLTNLQRHPHAIIPSCFSLISNSNIIIVKLKWHKNKEEHHINSPQTEARQATHPEITLVLATLSTPITINTSAHTSMANVREMENTSMPMEIDTKDPLSPIKNTELADSPARIRESTTVLMRLSRLLGEWRETWRRHLRVCKQGHLCGMVDVRQETRPRHLYLP